MNCRNVGKAAIGNALGSSLAYSMSSTGSASDSSTPISVAQAERNLYGGMTQREVVGGERDWLGSIAAYNGNIDAPTAEISDFRALDAAIKDAQIPKTYIVGLQWTADQKLDYDFGIVRETPSLAAWQASELGAGIWAGIKGIPHGIAEGVRTVADGYRGIGYLLSGNLDDFRPRSTITLGGIARGIYENSPVGMLGAMADNNYRGAGNRLVGTVAGLGAGIGLPSLKNLQGLSYDLHVAASRGARSMNAMAPDVSMNPFAPELSRGSSIRVSPNDGVT